MWHYLIGLQNIRMLIDRWKLTTDRQRGIFCMVSNWLCPKSIHKITNKIAPYSLLTILYVITFTFNHRLDTMRSGCNEFFSQRSYCSLEYSNRSHEETCLSITFFVVIRADRGVCISCRLLTQSSSTKSAVVALMPPFSPLTRCGMGKAVHLVSSSMTCEQYHRCTCPMTIGLCCHYIHMSRISHARRIHNYILHI